jgi:hypothetical protein
VADDRRMVIGDQPAKSAGIPATVTAARALSLVFLLTVALCLLLPLLQTIFPIFGPIVPPLEERREPSSFPEPRLLLAANGDFGAGFNKWFNDRVGFRDLFIRTKNQIDYSLFRTSRKVYVGKDGWLFGRGEIGTVERLSPAQLTELEDRFVQLANRLQDKGIRLIVVGYPDKSQIYPEMAPPQMPVIPDGGNFDQLRHFLANQPSLTFIDAKALLKQARLQTQDRLFAKTDLHPTEIGQVPIVEAIVARIAQLEGRPDIRWDEHFTVGHARWDGGADGRFLSLLRPTVEVDYPYFIHPYLIGGDEPDGKWNLPDRVALERADDAIGRPYDWEFRSNPELCPQRLPGTVLFGSSFSDFYWALGLHRYFCFIRRTRDPMSRFKLFYQTIPPGTKYMIFQYVSFSLPNAAPSQDYAQ